VQHLTGAISMALGHGLFMTLVALAGPDRDSYLWADIPACLQPSLSLWSWLMPRARAAPRETLALALYETKVKILGKLHSAPKSKQKT